jgi:phosphonoacetaldehyde hydrolase
MTETPSAHISLVVFDLAGTTVDHGCFAPVAPFVEALRRHGVHVTVDEVRAPMGLAKVDHLRTLLAAPAAAAQWRERHGAGVTDADVERVYAEDFVPLQLASVPDCSTLITGVLECATALRGRGVKVGTTTGYFAAAAELCWSAARRQGFEADCNVQPEQVAAGRPAPWMIFRMMEMLGVYPPRCVVKVGDTIPDIEEGLNAGVWSVGVAETGSDVGLSEAELAALPADERERRVAAAREKLLAAGAHYVIDSVRDIPELLPVIEARMRSGELAMIAPR